MKKPKYDEKANLRMYVSRSFDIKRPGAKIDDIKGGVLGGSIVQGSLAEWDEIELKPGIIKKEGAKPVPLVFKATTLMEESEVLKEAGPGGLVAIGSTLDPALTKADSLVGSVIGKKGQVPDPTEVIKVKYTLLKRADNENQPLKENEPVVVNVHTSTTVGFVTSLSKGIATIRMKKPIVVYKDMYVALSRRFGQRWRLSAWGNVV